MPEPAACQADVAAGRIVVNAPLSALLVCGRIPGGNWDRTKRVWIYPATTGHAKLIKDRIPRLEATGAFAALLRNGHAPQPAAPAPQPRPAGPEAAIPDGLITRPWRHQVAAYKFCLERIAKGFRGFLLAMGMGTGKSLVACMLILGLKARRVLIACPLRVVPVWIAQFERHVGIPVVVAELDEDAGSVADKQRLAAEKLQLAEARGVPFIAVVNYDSAWREPFAGWAEKQNWDLVIADEAHRIKAPGGKASLFFKRMRTKARYRAGLTGTPMPHSHTDIYAPFRFLDIGIFGPSFNAFRQEYCVMGGYQKKQVVAPRNLDKVRPAQTRRRNNMARRGNALPQARSGRQDLQPVLAIQAPLRGCIRIQPGAGAQRGNPYRLAAAHPFLDRARAAAVRDVQSRRRDRRHRKAPGDEVEGHRLYTEP